MLRVHLLLDVIQEFFLVAGVDPEELGVGELEHLIAGGNGFDLLEIVFDDLVELDQRDQGGLLDLLIDGSLGLLQVFDELHQENLHQNPRDDEDLDIIKILAAQKLLKYKVIELRIRVLMTQHVVLHLVRERDEKVIHMVQGVLDALALLPVRLALQKLQIVEDVIFVLFYNKELKVLQ